MYCTCTRLFHVCTPRRCGVTLPAGYHTIPSLDELDSMTIDMECQVQNFTIIRRGYGEIHFPGLTNVYKMNLGQIGKLTTVYKIFPQNKATLMLLNKFYY